MNLQELTNLITYIALGIAGLGYGIGQFQKSRFGRRKDDADAKKDAFSLLQEQIDSLSELCQKQQKEITILQTQVEERDKKAREYVEIFQNRNPEMINFMKYLTETANASNAYMKDTSLLFTQLKPVLEKIEAHLANAEN